MNPFTAELAAERIRDLHTTAAHSRRPRRTRRPRHATRRTAR